MFIIEFFYIFIIQFFSYGLDIVGILLVNLYPTLWVSAAVLSLSLPTLETTDKERLEFRNYRDDEH